MRDLFGPAWRRTVQHRSASPAGPGTAPARGANRRPASLLAALCLAALPATAPAAEVEGQSCRQRDGDTSRPRVGLALGGGGARGMAHISVLRKLEEMRIPVDCIAGTSMGSLAGGLYAAGVPLDEMEQLVRETDWKRLFDDSIDRRERSYRRKQDDRDGVATIGVGIGRTGLRVSPGVLQGERILSLFERKTLPAGIVDDFDELPIPFRALATDLNTGLPVELASGSLAEAMRASMSLPGIFQPVQIDGRVLIDGGIAEQVPIDTVRRMGADIVIAVDVGTPLMQLGSDASALQVISQLTGMLTVGNTRNSTARLGPGDVLITPALGDEVATGDFQKAAEALRIGDEAADAAADRLAALPRLRATPPRRQADPEPVLVDFVRLENDSRYADEVLLAIIDVPVGEPLDAAKLEQATLRAFSMGTFASVNYRLVREDGRTGVVVRAREKPQGPNYLQAGYRMETDFSGTYESSLRLALLRAPVTRYGAEARLLLGLGSEPEIQGEYFHPFDPRARWYFYGRLGAERSSMPIFNADGDRVALYDAWEAGARVGLGQTLGLYGAVEAGLERTTGEAEVEIGDPALPDVDTDTGAWYAFVSIDRLDSLYFPRHGYSARASYRATVDWMGGRTDFSEVGLDLLGAQDFGRHALQLGVNYHATVSGLLPIVDRYRMGGRGRLVGFHFNELTGQNYAVVTVGYSYQLASLFSRSAVAGATLEYGNAWERRDAMRWSDGILNGSVYLGFDSWIGPMLFGYGMREGGAGVLFLEIGQTF